MFTHTCREVSDSLVQEWLHYLRRLPVSEAAYGIMTRARTYHHHHYHYLRGSRSRRSREANHCSRRGCKLSTRCSAAVHDADQREIPIYPQSPPPPIHTFAVLSSQTHDLLRNETFRVSNVKICVHTVDTIHFSFANFELFR